MPPETPEPNAFGPGQPWHPEPVSAAVGAKIANAGVIRPDLETTPVEGKRTPFYVFWWVSPTGFHNFGDEITPFLLRRLSPGLDLRRIDFEHAPLASRPGFALDALRKGRLFRKTSLRRIFRPGPVHFCAGSILRLAPPGSVVWGSGFGRGSHRFSPRPLDVRALRGTESLKKLRAEGLSIGDVPVGDPGLLLPVVLKRPAAEPVFEVGFVPHYVDYDDLARRTGGCPCLDLKTADVPSVVEKLWQCRLVLSSSLHGLIVGHAYGIPAIWMKSGRLGSDDFKFRDYFSSVGIPTYEPVRMDRPLEEIVDSAKRLSSFALPRADTARLRRDLLSVAPFPVAPSVLDAL